MRDTKIRWAGSSWNPMTGCTEISPGCDRCYAKTIAEPKRGTPSFPNGFDPTFKPHKLADPGKPSWLRAPRRVFVNSMSDVHHEAFDFDQIDAVYDVMLAYPEHDYLVLTKRPQRMVRYFLGSSRVMAEAPDVDPSTLHPDPDSPRNPGWLARRQLEEVPANIWLGTSIESGAYTFRADHLRRIPAVIRFLSIEPMIGPVLGAEARRPLDLTGIGWAIVGGESGVGYRDMPHSWAAAVRDACLAQPSDDPTAFYFKQSAHRWTERGIDLDDGTGPERWEEYPLPHPPHNVERARGVYVDDGGASPRAGGQVVMAARLGT